MNKSRDLLLLVLLSQTGLLTLGTDNQYCDKEKGCKGQTDGPDILSTDSDRFSNFKEEKAKRFQDINNLPPLNDGLYLIEEDEMPQILWWYDFFPHKHLSNEIQCTLGKCKVFNDYDELKNPLTRGIIFYGTSVYANDLPLPRLPHHEWALFHEESPSNQWMFSDELGISLFNHTATFRRESDYPISTFAMHDPDMYFDPEFYVPTNEKNRLQKEEGLAPAVFVQRHCRPASDRDTYIEELMKYIQIDSFGRCLNNKEMPDEIDGFHKLGRKEYFHFLARYKFQIAFENAVCQDYMTEKLVRPLQIGSVPIYYGSPLAEDFMPSNKAVIMVNDFKSPKELAEFLMRLNNDDTLYEEYLQHRKVRKITNPKFLAALERQPWKIPHRSHSVNFASYMFTGYSCYVCDQIHKRNNMLKLHLKDKKQHIKPVKMGQYDHMGCPRPFPIMASSQRNRAPFMHFDFGRPEAEAIVRMLQANETNSQLYETKYLKMYTDKYPKPRTSD